MKFKKVTVVSPEINESSSNFQIRYNSDTVATFAIPARVQ